MRKRLSRAAPASGPRQSLEREAPYFLSVEAARAVSPSATTKRSAVKRGRFSASEGAVCAKSDANWGVGLGAGRGAGCCRRPTTSGSRAMSPSTRATPRRQRGGHRSIQRRQPEEQGGEERNNHEKKKNRGDEAKRHGDHRAPHRGLRRLLHILLRESDDLVAHPA